MIHSILIIGQSNMAGRGISSEVAPLNHVNGRIKVLRNGRWFRAYRPLNPDRATAGVCLAESFAEEYAKAHEGVDVGIIPCADGGTSLSQWQRGGLLFDNAVNVTRLAMRTSNLVAILWHQGEADCGDSCNKDYFERLCTTMSQFRDALDAYNIPIIVGGLGDFLKNCSSSPLLANYPIINEQLKRFANTASPAAYASAEGLLANPDNLHFCAGSLLEFGRRYYAAFDTIEDKNRIFDEKSDMDSAIRSDMELL